MSFRPYSPPFSAKNRYKTVTPILGILTLSAACNASQAILESAHSVVIEFLDTTGCHGLFGESQFASFK